MLRAAVHAATSGEAGLDVTMDELDANGQRFVCRRVGDEGEGVVLLHGFPETSKMWTRLMGHLADAGYRCVAPDQRGYSPGARPPSVDDYRYEELGADVHAIAAAAGFERYHLVAHDWGAGAAWAALELDPSSVVSYTSLSIPHYTAFAEAVWSDPEEEPYRGFLDLFTAPDGLAEEVLGADDLAGFRDVWTESAPDEVDAYLEVFRQPGALTGALNWYRAAWAHRRALDDPDWRFGPVSTPTVLLWGRDDPYVRRMSVTLAEPHMVGEYRVVELDAGHWLVQQRAEQVEVEVLAHLAAHPIG